MIDSAGVASFDDATVVRFRETLLPPVTGHVAAGEVLAITGANGSGKTTLLRLLAGMQRPTAGSVLVHGAPPKERDRRFRARVASLVGRPALAHDLTLAEQLAVVGVSWGVEVDAAERFARDGLEAFEIQGLSTRFPHELSSGQAQLFALAGIFARPSSLLLLDEPEQRLDEHRRGLVAERIVERATTGTAIVVVTHSEELVDGTADHELHLHGGTAGTEDADVSDDG